MAAWDNDPVVGEASVSAQPQQPAWANDPVVEEAAPQKSDIATAKESLGKFSWEEFAKQNPTINVGKAIKMEAEEGTTIRNTLGRLGMIADAIIPVRQIAKFLGHENPDDVRSEKEMADMLKESVQFIKERPLTATAELAKSLVYSPELLLLGASKGPQMAARYAELAKAGRAARALASTGVSAAEGGGAMAGASAIQQYGEKGEVNPEEVKAAGLMGALMIPAIKGAGSLLKAGDRLAAGSRKVAGKASPENATTPTLDRFAETVSPEGEVHNPAELQAREPLPPGPKDDARLNASQRAYDLMQRGASKKEVEAAIKKNPLLEQAMEEIRAKRGEAKESFGRDVKQGEWLGPEEPGMRGAESAKESGVGGRKAKEPASKPGQTKLLGSPEPPPAQPESTAMRALRRQQGGEADPKLLASIGLVAGGAAAGSYLAGDNKIAGAVLGGIAGAGLMRFGGNLAALGKTLSPRQVAWNTAKIGSVIGAGAYLGDKSGDPVYGAAIAASILLGAKALKPAVKMSTDEFINLRNGNIAAQNRITHNLVRDIQTAVPDGARRVAISEALDRGSMEGLTAPEQKVYSAVRGFLDSMGKEAKDADVIRGMRSNYISYIVERAPNMTAEQESGILQRIFEGSEGTASGSPKSKFGKQGKYESFEEINRALEGSGLRLKTKDVGEILGIYAKSMRQAIENKILLDNLKAAKTPEGIGYLVKGDKNGNLPQGYQTLNHPQLRGYGVHPDLVDSMKTVMNNSDPNVVTRGLHGLSMATKRVQVFGSLFHAKSLGEVYLNAMGKDFYSVKTGVNRAPIDAALKMYREGGLGDTLDLGIRNGLMMEIPLDVSQSIIGDIGKSIDAVIPKLTGAKESKLGTSVTDKIDWVNGKMDKLTWDYMHAGIKGAVFLKEFETMLARNAEAHAREPGKIPLKSREQIAAEVAKYANDLTGGLDWFRIAADSKTQLGRNLGMYFASPQGKQFAQIIAFAPDWAVSTLRAGFNTFGKSDSTLRGLLRPENTTDLYRRYAMRSTLYWVTLLNGINMATSGRPILQNKDPTRIEFEDGTSMQAGKHTFETAHAVMDPVKFAYNKLGFTPHMMIELKDRYYDKAPREDTFPGYVAKAVLPFGASPAFQPGLSAGEKVKRSALSAIGLPVYGRSAEQKAAAKVERTAEKERKRRKKLEEDY